MPSVSYVPGHTRAVKPTAGTPPVLGAAVRKARPPEELKLADLSTFLAIARSGSVSGAARSLGVTPSQASKAVVRLEQQLHARLLVRGARGVTVSSEGARLMPRAIDLLTRARELQVSSDPSEPELTVVASAWLTLLFVPRIFAAKTGCRVRTLDLPPGTASAWASGHSFDVALTTGDERWPGSWLKVEVGTIRKALYGSPAIAERLGRRPVAPARLAEHQFISPIYAHQGQVLAGDDGCPLRPGERRIGHETQTLAMALDLAAMSEQLVFSPVLAARGLVESGRLVEIRVEGWDVRETLYLVCDAESVRARVQRELISALRTALGA